MFVRLRGACAREQLTALADQARGPDPAGSLSTEASMTESPSPHHDRVPAAPRGSATAPRWSPAAREVSDS
ncbi:hypothetical protein ACU686_13870 [Yinghuangia aomiensis]